jgi:hypothetical protein
MLERKMRVTDIALIVAAAGALVAAVEARNRVDISPPPAVAEKTSLITCPMKKTPDFAVVMQAAVLGDGALIIEQQTNTRVRDIKDC